MAKWKKRPPPILTACEIEAKKAGRAWSRKRYKQPKAGSKKAVRAMEKAKRVKRNEALTTPKRNSRVMVILVPDVRHQNYATRDEILLRMGFASYDDYLHSEAWYVIRRLVWARRGHNCTLCPGHASQLHHNSYAEEDLRGDVLSHIHPVCDRCHKAIEFTPTGQKRDFPDVVREFIRIVQGTPQ